MRSNENKKQRTVNTPILMALVLFWLVAVTTYLTSGLYARYITASQGSDSARVAQFGSLTLTETGDFGNGTITAKIIPGVDLTKDAHVRFGGSEMSTAVFVEIIVSDHWDCIGNTFRCGTHMTWAVENAWTYLCTDTYNGNTRYIFYAVPEINKPLEADIIANNGKITVRDDLTNETIRHLQNVSISFRASVIQTGGFDSIAAAWNALAAK